MPSTETILSHQSTRILVTSEWATIAHFPNQKVWLVTSWGKFNDKIRVWSHLPTLLSINLDDEPAYSIQETVKEYSQRFMAMENKKGQEERILLPKKQLFNRHEDDEMKIQASLKFIINEVAPPAPTDYKVDFILVADGFVLLFFFKNQPNSFFWS